MLSNVVWMLFSVAECLVLFNDVQCCSVLFSVVRCCSVLFKVDSCSLTVDRSQSDTATTKVMILLYWLYDLSVNS